MRNHSLALLARNMCILLVRILTFVAGVLAVAVSCSFRALNQSCVTGARPAIFLLRLYLCRKLSFLCLLSAW